jgi:hypothetical protein
LEGVATDQFQYKCIFKNKKDGLSLFSWLADCRVKVVIKIFNTETKKSDSLLKAFEQGSVASK